MKKIFVIEDELTILNGLLKMLSSWGYQVKSSTSGLKGIECLRSEKYDLVITDLRLRDIGGTEVLRRIKAASPEIKIIVLSGSLGEISTAEIEALGVFRLLEKPVSRKDIRLAVQKAFGINEAVHKGKNLILTADLSAVPAQAEGKEAAELSSPSTAKDEQMGAFSKGRILVVDDEEELSNSIKKLLTIKNYNVTTASDGIKAIEKIKSEKFDLILMDIRMPNMDGIESVKNVKKRNPEAFIVMMTGEAGNDESEKALEVGGYAVLRKPFSPEKLLKSISWFRNAEEDIKFRKRRHETVRDLGAWYRLRCRVKRYTENYRMTIVTVSLIVFSVIAGISLIFYVENISVSLSQQYKRLSSSYENYADKVIGYLERDEQRELKRK